MEKLKTFLKTIVPLADAEFDEARQYFNAVSLAKGDCFVRQGQVCKQIAFINVGMLRTYYLNDKAEEVTYCFCVANSLTTSYKSLILQEPSNTTLQAIEPTELWVIEYENLKKLYANNVVWQELGRVVAEQEFFVMEKYATVLNNETAKEKYLRLMKEQPHVVQKGNIEHIASYLGITRRTLSRIRQELTQEI